MTMNATVQTVEACSLTVCDHGTQQVVVVHTPNACHYCVGDCLCIRFSGAMTMSLPPQITATCITKLPSCGCC